MFAAKHQIYLPADQSEIYFGYVAEVDFFLVLETVVSSKEEMETVLQRLREDCLNTALNNLADFDDFINQEAVKLNLSASFSLAAAYFKNDILYLKTQNKGEVYLKRKGQTLRLIGQSKSASGFLEKNDQIILTTQNHNLFLKQDKHYFEKIYQNKQDNLKSVFLFVDFYLPHQKNSLLPMIDFSHIKTNLQLKLATSNKKKLITLLFVGVLLIIFAWSVIFGHQRRQEADQKIKIQNTKVQIQKQLAEAEELGFLNSQKASSLITQAKEELEKLKNSVNKDNQSALSEINNLIQLKENLIFKKEEGKVEEFFDLRIDNKNAFGIKASLSGEDLAVLDNKNGAIYNLSLAKKSLTTLVISEAKNADLIANGQDTVFIFIKNNGIYKISKGKTTKIIEVSKEWGEIGQMVSYNSNLYLLDKTKNEVYKYLATDNGFASGAAYFKSGQEIDLSSANSLAINGSLYFSLADGVVKYTSGLRDGFKTSYPKDDVSINKVIADKNLEQIFAWDKKNASVYKLDKDGTYEKEVTAKILGSAYDVIVFENAIYALAGEKIYKISL